MTNILSRIFKKNETLSFETDFDPLTFRKSLLKMLVKSHKKETIIGIYSDVLGDGMFVTGVEQIHENNGDHIIQLKRYDVIGTFLIRNTISLSEIKAVCLFDMRYKNPH